MQLHPAFVHVLLSDRERALRERARRRRVVIAGRRERTARTAPWPP